MMNYFQLKVLTEKNLPTLSMIILLTIGVLCKVMAKDLYNPCRYTVMVFHPEGFKKVRASVKEGIAYSENWHSDNYGGPTSSYNEDTSGSQFLSPIQSFNTPQTSNYYAQASAAIPMQKRIGVSAFQNQSAKKETPEWLSQMLEGSNEQLWRESKTPTMKENPTDLLHKNHFLCLGTIIGVVRVLVPAKCVQNFQNRPSALWITGDILKEGFTSRLVVSDETKTLSIIALQGVTNSRESINPENVFPDVKTIPDNDFKISGICGLRFVEDEEKNVEWPFELVRIDEVPQIFWGNNYTPELTFKSSFYTFGSSLIYYHDTNDAEILPIDTHEGIFHGSITCDRNPAQLNSSFGLKKIIAPYISITDKFSNIQNMLTIAEVLKEN